MQENKPLSRRSDLVTQETGNEILIYDLNTNKAFNLNQTSAMIWQLCDGNRTISEIARNLSGKLDTNITEDFVRLALDQLGKDNLLENSSEFIFSAENINRRDIIRKIGFSTLVALPIVSSLIAPMAINAGSACVVVPTNTPGRLNPNSQCGPPAQPTRSSSNCASCCCRLSTPTNTQAICGAPNGNPCI